MPLDADGDENDDDDGVMAKRRHVSGGWMGWLSVAGDKGLIQACPTIVVLMPVKFSSEKEYSSL